MPAPPLPPRPPPPLPRPTPPDERDTALSQVPASVLAASAPTLPPPGGLTPDDIGALGEVIAAAKAVLPTPKTGPLTREELEALRADLETLRAEVEARIATVESRVASLEGTGRAAAKETAEALEKMRLEHREELKRIGARQQGTNLLIEQNNKERADQLAEISAQMHEIKHDARNKEQSDLLWRAHFSGNDKQIAEAHNKRADADVARARRIKRAMAGVALTAGAGLVVYLYRLYQLVAALHGHAAP